MKQRLILIAILVISLSSSYRIINTLDVVYYPSVSLLLPFMLLYSTTTTTTITATTTTTTTATITATITTTTAAAANIDN